MWEGECESIPIGAPIDAYSLLNEYMKLGM